MLSGDSRRQPRAAPAAVPGRAFCNVAWSSRRRPVGQSRGDGRGGLRGRAALAGSACLLAVVAFAALAGDAGARGHSTGPLELEQAHKLQTFENKLAHDKGQLDTVIHRLGEIKSAEAKIKHEQANLLRKEKETRATVHSTRDKMVSLKYKIHDMKTVAFSDAMFGLSTHRDKKAKAHASLERKARSLEKKREHEVAEETDTPKPKARPAQAVAPVLPRVHSAHTTAAHGDCFSAVPGWCAEHGAKEAAATKPAGTPAVMTSAKRAEIIARGLKKTKIQLEEHRKQAKIRAAANLALKKRKLQVEQGNVVFGKHDGERARALEAAHQQFKADEVQSAGMAEGNPVLRPHVVHLANLVKDVSSMQARVLRKRVAAMAHGPRIIGQPLHMSVTPTHMQRKAAAPHKPLTLVEAAKEASHNAAVAQNLAYMRSPQYWQSQTATHTTKRYGMMPGLPLLAPLDPAAADQ